MKAHLPLTQNLVLIGAAGLALAATLLSCTVGPPTAEPMLVLTFTPMPARTPTLAPIFTSMPARTPTITPPPTLAPTFTPIPARTPIPTQTPVLTPTPLADLFRPVTPIENGPPLRSRSRKARGMCGWERRVRLVRPRPLWRAGRALVRWASLARGRLASLIRLRDGDRGG